jgi:hypothetical protein
MLYSARKRAAERGIPFDLTEDDIVVPDVCPILGVPLKTAVGPRSKNSASLDRIDPALGYVKGNVAVISDFANRIKQDASAEEVMAVALWMQRAGVK